MVSVPTVSPHIVMRRAILSLAGNPTVSGLMRRYGMRLGAARFVAGETLEEHPMGRTGIRTSCAAWLNVLRTSCSCSER